MCVCVCVSRSFKASRTVRNMITSVDKAQIYAHSTAWSQPAPSMGVRVYPGSRPDGRSRWADGSSSGELFYGLPPSEGRALCHREQACVQVTQNSLRMLPSRSLSLLQLETLEASRSVADFQLSRWQASLLLPSLG